MAFSFETLEAGKIVVMITRFTEQITLEVFAAWNAELDRLGAEHAASQPDFACLYLIMDVSQAQTDFMTIVQQMRVAPTQAQETDVQPGTLKMMFLGSNPMAKLTVELAKRKEFFGGMDIPIFPTLEDALAFIAIDRVKAEQASTAQAAPPAQAEH